MVLEVIAQAIRILSETGTLPPENRPHKLTGNYAGKWECHINGRNSDWLMDFMKHDPIEILEMVAVALEVKLPI